MAFVQIVTNISKVFPEDTEAPPAGVDDMTKLSYLHEPGVLQNLRTRYELNEIYVSHFPFTCLFYVLLSHIHTVLTITYYLLRHTQAIS